MVLIMISPDPCTATTTTAAVQATVGAAAAAAVHSTISLCPLTSHGAHTSRNMEELQHLLSMHSRHAKLGRWRRPSWADGAGPRLTFHMHATCSIAGILSWAPTDVEAPHLCIHARGTWWMRASALTPCGSHQAVRGVWVGGACSLGNVCALHPLVHPAAAQHQGHQRTSARDNSHPHCMCTTTGALLRRATCIFAASRLGSAIQSVQQEGAQVHSSHMHSH